MLTVGAFAFTLSSGAFAFTLPSRAPPTVILSPLTVILSGGRSPESKDLPPHSLFREILRFAQEDKYFIN